jgi:S1-C subfamily serine protease
MSSLGDWDVPLSIQPQQDDYAFDLDVALASVVSVRALTPSDAFTAETLGDDRLGNGVLIPGGLVLTIGYLIVEAQTIWLSFSDGSAVQGHTLGYDQQTGFALVQPLARVKLPELQLGKSTKADIDDRVVIGSPGGRERSIAAHIVARQEFAGYWEYVLEDAIFTAPAHPHWGGAPLINTQGKLIGIGSLQLQAADNEGGDLPLNMSVPVDLLKPILDDLKKLGRADRPVRPWLGLYSADIEGEVVVLGLAPGGPAELAGVDPGDIIVSVAGVEVLNLSDFYRKVWQQGNSGVEVPLTVAREQGPVNLVIKSGDRNALLKSPSLH